MFEGELDTFLGGISSKLLVSRLWSGYLICDLLNAHLWQNSQVVENSDWFFANISSKLYEMSVPNIMVARMKKFKSVESRCYFNEYNVYEQFVECVQNKESRHQKDVSGFILCLLLEAFFPVDIFDLHF